MDERLEFELDIDVKAAMLGHAIHALTQMDDKLGRVAGALEKMERSSAKARGMSTRFTEMASALSLVERAAGAAGRALAYVDKGTDYAIKAMGERSATVRGYTQLLGGDKRQASLEFYRAQEFAQKTDFSSEQIEKSQARLLAQGFRGQDLYATLFSAADLASIMPGDKNQTLERVTMAMSQIRAKGKLQGEELTQQLAEAGLNTTIVKEQIAKAMGIKVGDVDKKMGKGDVTADVALPAIQRAILQQIGTKKAGEYATGSAGSLTALISNRDEAIKNLLKSFDADEHLPAALAYKDVLKEQGRLFDLNTESGKNMSLVLQDMANAGLTAKTNIAGFVSGFSDSASKAYAEQLNKQNQGRDFDKELARSRFETEKLGSSVGGVAGGVAAQFKEEFGNVFDGLVRNLNEDLDELRTGNWRKFLFESFDPKRQLKDLEFEVKYDLARQQKEIDDFGTSAGSAKGGGGTGENIDLLNPRVATLAKAKEAKKKAAAASGKSGKSEYRGVFWDYDFNGVSTGSWAKAPTLNDVMAGNHTSAEASTAAITTAIAGSAGGQPIQIIIQGYNRDKGELAHEIANTLGRMSRRPR